MRTTPLRGKYYDVCCVEGTEVHRGLIICQGMRPWFGGTPIWNQVCQSPSVWALDRDTPVVLPVKCYSLYTTHMTENFPRMLVGSWGWGIICHVNDILNKAVSCWIPQWIWISYSKNIRLQKLSSLFCFFCFLYSYMILFSLVKVLTFDLWVRNTVWLWGWPISGLLSAPRLFLPKW